MSDVNDKFHLFLTVTPMMDFIDAAGGSSVEMDFVFWGSFFFWCIFCGQNLIGQQRRSSSILCSTMG